jgi:hypothetical protein
LAVDTRVALTYAGVWVIALAAWQAGRPELIRSPRLVLAHVRERMEWCSAMLALYLQYERRRPLYAYVAAHNIGSRRVLEKCGFTVVGEEHEDGVDGIILMLAAQSPNETA